MAFTTGTATSHNDLLDKLRLYLVAQGWTQQAWTAGATVNDPSTLYIRGPGAGADKRVYLAIKTLADATAGYYSWEMRGAIDYSAALSWGNQVSQSPLQCNLNLWQNSITYWFYVNDRRVIIVAKCSTNYMSAHLGFFLPWGTPADFPFPLFIAGDFYQPQPYSYSNSARRMFVDAGNDNSGGTIAASWARTADGIWYPFGNHNSASNNNYAYGYNKGQKGVIWPYHTGSSPAGYGIGNQYNPSYWNGGSNAADPANGGEAIVPTQQNERCLLPIMLCPGDQAPLGVLDGVYWVAGSGLATEQQITIGARTFRVFQNINRNSPDDFFCVEEI